MSLSTSQYAVLEAKIKELILQYQPFLTDEDIDYAKHYLLYGEIEMAFEILGLALIHNDEQISFTFEDRDELVKIGLILKLNIESVFDARFWANFLKYLEQN